MDTGNIKPALATSHNTRDALIAARVVRREIQEEIQILQKRIRRLKAKYRWAVHRQDEYAMSEAACIPGFDKSHTIQLSNRRTSAKKRLRQAGSRRIGNVRQYDAALDAMQASCHKYETTLEGLGKHHSKKMRALLADAANAKKMRAVAKRYQRALHQAEEKLIVQQLFLRQAQRDVVTARYEHARVSALRKDTEALQGLLYEFAIALKVTADVLQGVPLSIGCDRDEALHLYIGNPKDAFHGHIVLDRQDKVIYRRLPGEPHGAHNIVT